MKYKVGDWEDLNGISNEDFKLDIFDLGLLREKVNIIQVRQKKDSTFIGEMRDYEKYNCKIIDWLKSFGFDIEFEKIKETKRILSKKDYEFLNSLLFNTDKKIERTPTELHLDYMGDCMALQDNMFKSIKMNEGFTFKELKKWEVETE